jgi:hypothetical protein
VQQSFFHKSAAKGATYKKGLKIKTKKLLTLMFADLARSVTGHGKVNQIGPHF